MSGRRTGARELTVCSWRCDRPTRDGALVCDECLDDLAGGLRELIPSQGDRPEQVFTVRVSAGVEWCPFPRPMEIVPGLWDELQATIIGERAIAYNGGGGSGSGESGVVSVGLNLNENASWAAAEVVRWLRHLIRLCQEYRLDHHAEPGWKPRSVEMVPAMSEWLAWRIDAMAWQPEVADAAGYLFELIDFARWAVDRPATRQQLGDCPVDGCDGHLSAVQGQPFASCFRCRHQVEAQPLRDELLGDLDDRLCTAAEIARLSTYLGLRADRDRTRQAIYDWVRRDQLRPKDYIVPTEPNPDDRDGEPVEIPPYAGPSCRGKCHHDSCPVVADSRGVPLYLFREVSALMHIAEERAGARTSKPAPPITHTSKGA